MQAVSYRPPAATNVFADCLAVDTNLSGYRGDLHASVPT